MASPAASDGGPATPSSPPTTALTGTVDRITYHNPDNGYTVARLSVREGDRPVTIVGYLSGVNVGASFKVWGRWTNHARYGRQFDVASYREELPATIEGIRKYLGSGLIKGVGPVTASRIVDHFGTDTLTVLEDAPEKVREVPGVGERRATQIAEAWQAQREIKAIMVFLQSHEVSTALAVKIFRQYGDQAIAIVKADPYRLARDIFGVGFVTADRIARSLGLAADSPARIEAGIAYALSRLADEGHVFAPHDELVLAATGLLEVDASAVEPALTHLVETGALIRDRVESAGGTLEAIYLPPFYHAEVATAQRLRRMMAEPATRLGAFRNLNWESALRWVEARQPQPLAARQREAVVMALTNKVSILTGGPGTGKTTTVRAVLALLRARGATVALAAPTGRAAKRLAETTGVEAKTIHRLLEFKPQVEGLFARTADNPIAADLIVIDEVSMVDALLMNALTRAIDPASHLLLVGDADQLPSVGPGNVLRDLIASGAVPVVTLDQIFRQAQQSLIVVNAHRINHGQMPILGRDEGDFFLFPAEDQETAADRIVDVVLNRIPNRFGLDPTEDIQVLSPMHRGAAGVTALNHRLRDVLNPPRPGELEARGGGQAFRLGDKVMQIRNNYVKDIFNGDVGRVAGIDTEDQRLTVIFDGQPVTYDYDELDELVLAFACSTHKSQGAEYPAVVMALLPAHYVMLQRNLLYTGVTRARRLCVLVGAPRAIKRAIHNDRVTARHTLLAHRLRPAPSQPPFGA